MLEKWGGIRFPLDKKWKRKAVEYVVLKDDRIRQFLAFGEEALLPGERKALLLEQIGPQNGHDPEDYRFTMFLLDECLGDAGLQSPRFFWFRCAACTRIRSQGGMNRGPCKCGATRIGPTNEPLPTQRILKILATGC